MALHGGIPLRVSASVDRKIANGEFYDAHQLVRTLFFRCERVAFYRGEVKMVLAGLGTAAAWCVRHRGGIREFLFGDIRCCFF